MVLVQIATTYLLFKWFAGRIDRQEERHTADINAKDATIKSFAAAWERQTDALNRRTRAENQRTEVEALQLASRPDLHFELKNAANEVIRRLKDEKDLDPAQGNGQG
jgi:hypothetical protein